jgi:hypothetical protein
MTTPPLAEVPLRSADDLTRRWRTLLDPPVFGARSLWLAWLDNEGLMLPVVVPIDDVPPSPHRALLSGVLHLHDAVVEQHLGGDDGHLAMALCRPGPPETTEDDDAWAEALQVTFDDLIDGTWSLHLAAAGTVTPLVGPPPFLWRRRSGEAGPVRRSGSGGGGSRGPCSPS